MSATGHVETAERDVTVHLHHRAHNPLLIAAGFPETDVALPWLASKRLHSKFGS